MIMDALFIGQENAEIAINKDQNKRNEWTPHYAICIEELEPLLAHLGIEMGSMYKFDKTMEEVEIENNTNFTLF